MLVNGLPKIVAISSVSPYDLAVLGVMCIGVFHSERAGDGVPVGSRCVRFQLASKLIIGKPFARPSPVAF